MLKSERWRIRWATTEARALITVLAQMWCKKHTSLRFLLSIYMVMWSKRVLIKEVATGITDSDRLSGSYPLRPLSLHLFSYDN